ncbi:hypothetical protein EXIGLDRAFT_445328 [Exidia glandulosa HHB12029]|uniref:Uncharacterized protein n=1 Tax=Exidia glandulosa HHB12029 TaxID=1314781 RepID=A0A165B5X0_EXIGL|nr:hypothetical protein EXIGLDRAFT_445328 [Exidia glandulosa HHB12029]
MPCQRLRRASHSFGPSLWTPSPPDEGVYNIPSRFLEKDSKILTALPNDHGLHASHSLRQRRASLAPRRRSAFLLTMGYVSLTPFAGAFPTPGTIPYTIRSRASRNSLTGTFVFARPRRMSRPRSLTNLTPGCPRSPLARSWCATRLLSRFARSPRHSTPARRAQYRRYTKPTPMSSPQPRPSPRYAGYESSRATNAHPRSCSYSTTYTRSVESSTPVFPCTAANATLVRMCRRRYSVSSVRRGVIQPTHARARKNTPPSFALVALGLTQRAHARAPPRPAVRRCGRARISPLNVRTAGLATSRSASTVRCGAEQQTRSRASQDTRALSLHTRPCCRALGARQRGTPAAPCRSPVHHARAARGGTRRTHERREACGSRH